MALTKVGKEGITGIDNSSDATAMTISSDEDVMIGTTDESSGAKFIVGSTDDDKRAFFQGSNQYRVGLKNGSNNHVFIGSGGADNFRVSNSSGSTLFELNSSGNIVLPSSNAGIHLGVTSATASNLLDDYEEGTWTPATSSSSYNTSSSTGLYTKIGRTVIAHFSINFSGVNSSSNAICTITNFPFTNGGAIASAGTVRESSNTGAVYTTRIGTNTTTATMNSMDNVTNGSQRTIRTGEDYVGTLIYVL